MQPALGLDPRVKARVRARQYPDGKLAVFHGPRRIGGYTPEGEPIIEAPAPSILAPRSKPSRRGLETEEQASRSARRPALTRPAREAPLKARAGTSGRASSRTKKRTPAKAKAA